MKIYIKVILISLMIAFFTACSTMKAEKVGNSSYQITLSEKGQDFDTSKSKVIYQGAKTTLENGFKFFVVSEEHYFGLDNKSSVVDFYQTKISCFANKPNNEKAIDANEYLSSHSKPDGL